MRAVLLCAAAILATPADAAAQATTPPPAAKAREQWKGEVAAVDPALGVVCVRLPDGQMREFHGSSETLKGYKIGDKLSGTIRRSRGPGDPAAVGKAASICPVPPPLRMTYKRWLDDTAVRLATRAPEIRAVDDALKAYGEAKDETQRLALRAAVQKAFDAWKAKEGDWRKSPRNDKGAAQILDDELSAKATAGLGPDEARAWAVVEQHHKEALADLFKGQKLVLKRVPVRAVLQAADDHFNAKAKAAQNDLPAVDDVKAEERAEQFFALCLGEAKDHVWDEVKGLLKDAAYHAILGAQRGPWGELVMEWKDTVKAAWDARKVREARGAFAAGDPSAAFDAMLKDLTDDAKKEATKAGVATLFSVAKLATAAIPVVPAALDAVHALGTVLYELHELAKDAADAAKANALIAQGALDANLFKDSSLLAAYYLANADTSAVIFLARPFGVPGFVRETEEMVNKARPVLDKAKEMILSKSYEIPGLRHMKGGTVDSTAKTLKKLPKGKVDKALQDAKDAMSRDSAGQAPAAPSITPETATPLLFAGRWIEWTEVALRPRSTELKALDQAVKDWGRGRDDHGRYDRDILRDAVRVALSAWQEKESDWKSSRRNGKGAITALEAKIGPYGPGICPRVPSDCNELWNDKPREDGLAGCAAPPRLGCTQVVLGRSRDIEQYLGCPGYITLNLSESTPEANDRFLACAAAGRLGATCNPPIHIASGWENIPASSTTFHQLSQLKSCGCTMTVNNKTSGFALACPNGLHGRVACPLVPRSCEGPWQDKAPLPGQPRPADYPKCADPPWNGAKQVVIGNHDDIKRYIGCPGYMTLNLSASDATWVKKQDDFVACAAADKLGATANPPILIASGWDRISTDSPVFRALTQLRMCKCTMEVAEKATEKDHGRVDRCPAPVGASVPGFSRLFAGRAYGADPPSGWDLLMDLVRPTQTAPAVSTYCYLPGQK